MESCSPWDREESDTTWRLNNNNKELIEKLLSLPSNLFA